MVACWLWRSLLDDGEPFQGRCQFFSFNVQLAESTLWRRYCAPSSSPSACNLPNTWGAVLRSTAGRKRTLGLDRQLINARLEIVHLLFQANPVGFQTSALADSSFQTQLFGRQLGQRGIQPDQRLGRSDTAIFQLFALLLQGIDFVSPALRAGSTLFPQATFICERLQSGLPFLPNRLPFRYLTQLLEQVG